MPTVAQSLGTDLLGVSWALLSYQLSNIGLSMIFGRISDLWGREKMFALGLSRLCRELAALRLFADRAATDPRALCSRRRRRDAAVVEPGAGGGVGDRGSRRTGAGLHDDGAPCGLYPWAEHRRLHDRLLELALEFFSARAGRLLSARCSGVGQSEAPPHHRPSITRYPSTISARRCCLRSRPRWCFFRPSHRIRSSAIRCRLVLVTVVAWQLGRFSLSRVANEKSRSSIWSYSRSGALASA